MVGKPQLGSVTYVALLSYRNIFTKINFFKSMYHNRIISTFCINDSDKQYSLIYFVDPKTNFAGNYLPDL